jgi:integrase
VQHHLGHKSTSITLDRYGHLFPESWTTWPTA